MARVIYFQRDIIDNSCHTHIVAGGHIVVNSFLEKSHEFLFAFNTHIKCPIIFRRTRNNHFDCQFMKQFLPVSYDKIVFKLLENG